MPSEQEPLHPEQQARRQIDALLTAAGWVVQDYKDVNLGAGRGIALREVPLASGRCDYLLLVDRKAIGILEAKKTGTPLSSVVDQALSYAEGLPAFLAPKTPGPLPFLYESTGVETFFRDNRDPHPRSRHLFAFHRPETLAEWLTQSDTLRHRLLHLPPLATDGMRACQVEAITGLEESLAEDRPRALIQMATGAGKTFTACAFVYRLIKYAGAKRILFLVDRSNLGKQAAGEFQHYVTPDIGRKFTELYNVQHLTSNKLDTVSKVTICTIQRLYSMLSGRELPEDADDHSAAELVDQGEHLVSYNPIIPIETFDFIVTDECHRSIYNLWRQVLEYFDASLIGLTATPSKQTIGFFNKNLVTEYTHERAVADGVNVGYEVYRIRTTVTEQGGRVEKGFYVDKRDRLTRKKRWEQLDDDLAYAPPELDRSVVVPDQIRTVLQAYKDALFTELFPGRTLVPKALIFAKTDQHAEDIVGICREVFGKGDDFCKKVTYKAYNAETGRYEQSEALIQQFRTSPQFRIAVTVDMIATGTDIKPLECLLFLRDVRSRVYFEQMKGRGTRTVSATELQAVSGADALAKTQFIIVDAVGVCESDKSDSRPLERKRTVSLEKLLLNVALGQRDADALLSLAGRLARLDRKFSTEDKAKIADLAGQSLSQLSAALLNAVDPDAIAQRATGDLLGDPDSIPPEQFQSARDALIGEACLPFDQPALRDTLVKLKQENEQVIDSVTADAVLFQGFDPVAKEKAENTLRSFRSYIEEHRNEIAALQILYSRPFRQRLTEDALKELEDKLKTDFGPDPANRLWWAFAASGTVPVKSGGSSLHRFTDLVSLVRSAIEPETPLEPFEEHVHRRFAEWLQVKAAAGIVFGNDERVWLEKMRDYVIASGSVEREHLEIDNVLGPIYNVFGERLWPLMEELNLSLAA